MDTLCLCWQGMPGTGKRTKLLEHLRLIAQSRGYSLNLHTKYLTIGSATGSGEVEESDETTGERTTEVGQIAYESSIVHVGFDVSRMSMQDKNILRPVLLRLGQGSQVLAGTQGRGNRILVLYHAHLLSSESVLLLQAALEQNNGELSVWVSSETPVPQRIRDWFVEVPVAGEDRQMSLYKRNLPYSPSNETIVGWPDIFRKLFKRWNTRPTLKDIPMIKSFVYELLMRNLRWVECIHFILDVILELDTLTPLQRSQSLAILAAAEGTGGGQTLPSYRIPILWESLFLQLRNVISPAAVDGTESSLVSPRDSKKRKVALRTTSPQVA